MPLKVPRGILQYFRFTQFFFYSVHICTIHYIYYVYIYVYILESHFTATCGVTVPAGAGAVIGAFAIHRSAAWGPNPDDFDPDRFLPERSQKRHPAAFLPFSYGSRNCIGKKHQNKYLLATNLHVHTTIRRTQLMKLDKYIITILTS